MQRNLLLYATGICLFASLPVHADIVIDLKNGVVTETFNAALPVPVSSKALSPGYGDSAGYVNVVLVQKPLAGCAVTPYEALATVNLSPGNGQAPMKKLSVLVEYEGTPTGWTTHLGDDIANDGYGGGSGIAGVAELQVLEQDLSVYSSGFGVGLVDKLFGSSLRLAEGALHFNVANQSLAIGQPYTVLDSKFQEKLFDFTVGDKKLFAAFNRVISGRTDRRGCGAKKVHLVFE